MSGEPYRDDEVEQLRAENASLRDELANAQRTARQTAALYDACRSEQRRAWSPAWLGHAWQIAVIVACFAFCVLVLAYAYSTPGTGEAGGDCYGNHTCDDGLTCVNKRCAQGCRVP